jgi:uncharacterized protein YjbJ (UPF0337 family)
MDLRELPRTALHVQLRLLRLPLTIFETATGRGDGQRLSSRPQAEARQGLVDNVIGRAREVAGIVLGDDRLTAKGQVQQAKGEELREAAASEVIARQQRERAEAEFADRRRQVDRQRAEVDRKEAAEVARVERERAAKKADAEREAEARKEAAARTAEVERAKVARKQAKATQKRAAKSAGAARKRKAADAARQTAEVLEDTRTT